MVHKSGLEVERANDRRWLIGELIGWSMGLLHQAALFWRYVCITIAVPSLWGRVGVRDEPEKWAQIISDIDLRRVCRCTGYNTYQYEPQ
jgi:hypothetical protein